MSLAASAARKLIRLSSSDVAAAERSGTRLVSSFFTLVMLVRLILAGFLLFELALLEEAWLITMVLAFMLMRGGVDELAVLLLFGAWESEIVSSVSESRSANSWAEAESKS